MDDLESRLRAEVTRRMEEFSSSDDAQQRIEARLRQRRRQRQVLAGLAVGAAASLLAVVVVLVDPSPSPTDDVETGNDGQVQPDETTTTEPEGTTTTTTEPQQTTTTSSPSTTSSSTTTSAPPPVVAFSDFTPLSRRGIGPIQVGMRVTEADQAAGVSIEVFDPLTPDATCTQAQVSGTDIWFELELPGTPGTDPRTVGIIRSVRGRVTEEFVSVGASRTILEDVYGPPTRTLAHPLGIGEILIYESGGYAYAATIGEGRVRYLLSGDPAWIEVPEGCQ